MTIDKLEEWTAHWDEWLRLVAESESLKTQLDTAKELLHSCLEWDNGGERDYEAIVAFLNE